MLSLTAEPFLSTGLRKVKIQNGPVISKSLDLFVFVGISLLALGVPFVVDVTPALRYSLLMVLLYDGILTFGHAFGSLYPASFTVQNRHLTTFNYLLIMILCVVGGVWVFHLSAGFFITGLALWLLWHFTRQKVGWLKLSAKKSQTPFRLPDQIIIHTVCLMPVLMYLANPRVPHKMVLLHSNMDQITLPSAFHTPLTVLFFGLNGWYLLDQIQQVIHTRTLNPAKYVIILSGWLCFYLPFVCFPGSFNFWIPAAFVHSISYILYTYYFSKNHSTYRAAAPGGSFLYWPLKSVFRYTCMICLFGLSVTIPYYIGKAVHNDWFSYKILLPGVLSLLIFHFITDSFIWKSRLHQRTF